MAYLECHQGAYSTICAEVGEPTGGGGGGSGGAPVQTPAIPQTEDEQMQALIDSAEALLARRKYDVALAEIEEALVLVRTIPMRWPCASGSGRPPAMQRPRRQWLRRAPRQASTAPPQARRRLSCRC